MASKLAVIVRRAARYEPSWGVIVSLAVYLALVGLAMGQLTALLEAMRLPGSTGFSPSDLNDFPPDYANVEQTRAVLEVWRGYAVATLEAGLAPETADARDVLRLFAFVDSFFFVPLYVGTVGLFFLKVRREFAPAREPSTQVKRAMETRGLDVERSHDTYPAIAAVGIVLICVAGAADWIENACYARLVDEAWEGFPDRASAYQISGLVQILWWAALVKWVTAAAAVLAALGLGWILLARWGAEQRGRSRTGFWRAARLVVLPTVYVLLFGFALVQLEQIPDLVRRWLPYQLLVSSLLVAILAYAVWAMTRRLLTVGPWAPKRTRQQETRLKQLLLLAVLGLAGAQLIAHGLAAGGRYEPGWGLLVPTAALIALALFGWPIADPRGPDGAQDGGEPVEEPGDAGAVREPLLPRLLAAAILVFFGLGLMHASFGFAAYTKSWSWDMFAVALAAVAGAAAGRLARGRTSLPEMLEAAMPLLGAAVVAAIVFLLVELDRPTGDVDPSVTVVWAVLATTAGLTVYRILGRARPLVARLSRRLVAVLVVVVAGLYAAVVASPWLAGELLSGVGVLTAFLLVLTLATTFLTWLQDGIPVPKALLALGFRRFPLVLFLVVWFLAASYFDRAGAYHNARVQSGSQPATPVTLEEAFDCWLVRNGLPGSPGGVGPACRTGTATADRRGAVPMLFIASTGGGIRSAYWTGLAIDCTFELDVSTVDELQPCPEESRTPAFARSDSIFAASGISGGSLGLASYAAYLAEKDAGAVSRWVPRLSVDGLSPAGAWWLFVELPRVFLQFDSPTDRAATLERAWEREWSSGALERGLFELRRASEHSPLLLLNGTSVGDGCRFNVSVLDASVEVVNPREVPTCRSNAPFDESQDLTRLPTAGEQRRVAEKSALPATRDLADFLCGEPYDVSLSTAALLSARFPYVNPSGRIAWRCPGVDRPPVAHVVDGGYLDTSGASPIVELMTRLEPLVEEWQRVDAPAGTCVVPLMIQVDNGFEDTAPPRGGRRPAELLIPPKTVFDARIGRAAEARNAAALLFNAPFGGITLAEAVFADRYAHFVNQAHPGPAAPLGWAQSRYSEEELRSQLRQKKNLQALSEIRQWFAAAENGDLRCPGGDGEQP
jgi:hypothetical protein